jgi:hypothetical protein
MPEKWMPVKSTIEVKNKISSTSVKESRDFEEQLQAYSE